MRERLFREARSAGILSHPGIVTIYDVEQHGDVAYIAMEYVDGPTLDHVLSTGEPMPPEQLFAILGQIAAALDYAHQKGIVHRDIKPANIMIAADGTAKIADFGIAKITAAEQFTMTGSIVGTPHYMSPEQVQGQPVDGRADQFSLAVMAFEMLTGDKPYTGDHLTTVVYKIVAEEPMAPHRLNPSLGAAIENVLRRGLAKKPEGRYRTCQEFVQALESACTSTRGWKPMPRGGALSAPTVADAPRPELPEPVRPVRAGETIEERAPKRKFGFVPFLAAILAAAGLLALIGWQADPSLVSRWLPAALRPSAPAAKPAANEPQPGQSAAVPPAATPEAQPPSANPAAAKPSPMPPPDSQASAPRAGESPAEEPAGKKTAAQANRPLAEKAGGASRKTQPVTIISSPGGATATLDGRSDLSCTTPCNLEAAPGRHSLAVSMAGYQVEHRELDVGSSPVELPAVVLRAPGGTLMISSDPSGASLMVNGRRIPQTTPAQLPLSPGTYTITVEKDGNQSSSSVEVRNGEIKTLRVLLGK